MSSIILSGPATRIEEVPGSRLDFVCRLYEEVSSAVEEVFGITPLLSHEAFDITGRGQQRRRTELKNATLLIAMPVVGSWRGGADVQLAQQHGVSVIVLCATRCKNDGRVPENLLDGQTTCAIVTYSNVTNAVRQLRKKLYEFKANHGLHRRKPTNAKAAKVKKAERTKKRVRLELYKAKARA